MKPESAPNPLANESRRKLQQTPSMSPIMAHAKIWAGVMAMPQDQQAEALKQADYALPILGALAGNSKVKMRDVIKAAADAAGAGKITADEAITLISQMPQDQDKLRPWLRQMYAFQFTAAIHLKAEMMAEAQAQQQGAQPAQAMPPGAPGQAAAPQPTQVMPPQAAPAVNPQGPMP